MKLTAFIIVMTALILLTPTAHAEGLEAFDNSVEEIKERVDTDTQERMAQLGVEKADVTQIAGMDLKQALGMLGDMISQAAKAPLTACILLTAVIILSSLLESYTYSLRYVDTKDVMNAVTSLMVIGVLVTPITELIRTSLEAVKSAASLMLIYAPVMVAVMAFSGHVISSGGYYATVMAASQGIAALSGAFFAPLLHIFLALSVSSAISERVKLSGICELLAKLMKWSLTFAMSIFTAILSIQSFAASAADSVASKAVRFTLSSVIPVVGASVSEAYKAIQGSVNLLRSGIGVFVILAVLLTFLPLITQVILWQLSVFAAKTAAETFGVSSVTTVLGSISTVLSVLTALIVSLASVFLIATGALMAVGGGS